ncbi:MAG: NAD(P)H-quinone oxidoreductase subunit 1, chloroplastic [Myxococcota bacterium]|nr:NAD(P)H-quinone oxidoreductase subunit 1, chloroplastic [Myxococcota bacterium]
MTLAEVIIRLVMVALAIGLLMSIAPLLTWGERKWSALAQDRVGPNRAAIELAGKSITLNGLLYPLADGLKMIFKEDFMPTRGEKFLHFVSPWLAVFPALAVVAVIPLGARVNLFGHEIPMQVADLDAGILYLFAFASLSVYGSTLAGWASNNKYGLLGSLRTSSMLISYEVAMGLTLVGLMMTVGSLRLSDIVEYQQGTMLGFLPRWGIFMQPFGALLFFVSAFAETKRAPFDLPEAESELVAGYFIEYSGMKFGMFYLGEFVEVVTGACLFAVLFFGGWQLPWASSEAYYNPLVVGIGGFISTAYLVFFVITLLGLPLRDPRIQFAIAAGGFLGGAGLALLSGAEGLLGPKGGVLGLILSNGPELAKLLMSLMVFTMKILILCWFHILLRWTYPRFRYDQVMKLGWKMLLPAALVNLVVTGIVLLIIR